MNNFEMFKGLYKLAQGFGEIAEKKGIKTEIKEEIKAKADEIRGLADKIDTPIVATTFVGCRAAEGIHKSVGVEQSCQSSDCCDKPSTGYPD